MRSSKKSSTEDAGSVEEMLKVGPRTETAGTRAVRNLDYVCQPACNAEGKEESSTDRMRSRNPGCKDEILESGLQDLVEIGESIVGCSQLPSHLGQPGHALELQVLRHVEGITGRELGVHVDLVVDKKVDLVGVETVQFRPDIGQGLKRFQGVLGSLLEVFGHRGSRLEPFGRQRLVELRCIVG